ncbi:tautomerase family protein [Pedobacter sp. PAMC26386]|nr:tautomerase family protein [Pedobacter sp. PAMC26386]
MPFVNIYLPANFTAEVKKEISLSVHHSLMENFGIPENDYFQVIHAMDLEHLIFPERYLDIPHTADLIYIHITCGTGRTMEMKKELYASIAQKINERTKISTNDVIIILNEISWENWSFGEGIAQRVS